MDPVTAALVVVSAALHPLWYALVKRDPDPNAAFVGLNAVFAAIALGHAGLRGGGVMRSTDGARTWSDCDLPADDVFSIAVSPGSRLKSWKT